MEFASPDDPMTVMCKTVPMECQFPFTFKGKTYHECTNDLLSNIEPLEYDDESAQQDKKEQFLWCATMTDADGNMVHGMWGMCDLGTCPDDASNEDTSQEEALKDEEAAISELFKFPW